MFPEVQADSDSIILFEIFRYFGPFRLPDLDWPASIYDPHDDGQAPVKTGQGATEVPIGPFSPIL